MLKIKNSEEVEIQISSTAQNQFSFGNEFNLRDAKAITGIQVYSATDMTKSPNGASIMSQTNLQKGYLSLVTVEGQREVIHLLPLSSLQASNNNGQIREFDMPMINPSKCKVIFGDNSTLVLNDIILFAFYYEK